MQTQIQKQKTTKHSRVCFGITNLCLNGKRLLFFDYDDTTYNNVMNDLKNLQVKYKLSKIYIVGSENGYNAFCLDKLTEDKMTKILKDSKYICKDFFRLANNRGYYVLRTTGEDKHLLNIIDSGYNIHEKSNAHKIFFNKIMNFNILDDTNFDNNTKVRVYAYRNAKHGFMEIEQL